MTKSITYQVTVNECNTLWKLNGQFHREDGPAVEWTNGDKFWYINGKFHREDGPAIEGACGTNLWYINDKQMTEQEFNERTNPVVEVSIAQIEQLIGKRIKIVK